MGSVLAIGLCDSLVFFCYVEQQQQQQHESRILGVRMRNTTNTVLQLRWSLLRPRSHYRERRAAGSVLYQSVKKSCFKRSLRSDDLSFSGGCPDIEPSGSLFRCNDIPCGPNSQSVRHSHFQIILIFDPAGRATIWRLFEN